MKFCSNFAIFLFFIFSWIAPTTHRSHKVCAKTKREDNILPYNTLYNLFSENRLRFSTLILHFAFCILHFLIRRGGYYPPAEFVQTPDGHRQCLSRNRRSVKIRTNLAGTLASHSRGQVITVASDAWRWGYSKVVLFLPTISTPQSPTVTAPLKGEPLSSADFHQTYQPPLSREADTSYILISNLFCTDFAGDSWIAPTIHHTIYLSKTVCSFLPQFCIP